MAHGNDPTVCADETLRLTKPGDLLGPLRVEVMGELALQDAVGVEQVDAADVGDVGHDHRGDRGERGLLLERPRQQGAGAGQPLQPPLRRFGDGAGLPFRVEQALAFGFAAGAQIGGADQGIRHRLDLEHVRGRGLDPLAAAERERAVAQAADRAGDAAGHQPRRKSPEGERKDDAAAVGELRVPQGALGDRRRLAERHGPVAGPDAGHGGVDVLPFERRRRPQDLDLVGRLGGQRLQRGAGQGAQVFLMLARARDADVVGIEDGDDPLVGQALLADHLQHRLGPDHRRQDVEQLAVALDRNAHRNPGVAARAARQRTDYGCTRAHRRFEAGGLVDRRCAGAQRRAGAEDQLAGRLGEQDGAPLRPRREHAARLLIGRRERAAVGRIERFGQGQRLQGRDRQAQLGVDRGRQGAGEIDRRALDQEILLLPQGPQGQARHERQRQESDPRQQQQSPLQRHGAQRARLRIVSGHAASAVCSLRLLFWGSTRSGRPRGSPVTCMMIVTGLSSRHATHPLRGHGLPDRPQPRPGRANGGACSSCATPSPA